jgi:ankyrin repeat protein
MNNETSGKEINKELFESPHKKPFLSIDSEFSVVDLYKILLKNPYLVNTEDENNETFLSYAIKRNNNALINLILTSPLLNLTYQDNNGNTYLHLAVIQQNIKLVQKLLDKGIFIDIQNNDGNTALHLAYYINNLHIIKELINGNIDFCIKNKKGLVAEEIDPISDINEIAGYEVKMNTKMNLDDQEINEESFNLNLKQNEVNSQKIDSSNSGETKYKSQISKEKINFQKNNNNNFGISLFSTNKINSQNNNINSFLNNKNIDIKNDNIDTYINISKNNINESENDKDIKTIENDNNFPLYEEPIDQDFDIYKNNFSNFLENNSINNNGTFFLNDKGDNSVISNIPIHNDDFNNINQNQNKYTNIRDNTSNNNNKRKEKIINCANKSLYDFLLQINMQKYYDNLNNNGFEYINLILEDTKIGNYLTDKQLKMIGINIPGDRAKILIRFEEKANMFEFNIPKSVYYISNNLDHIEDDLNVCKLNGWLRNIRLEQYIRNFILNGYFSVDLLLIQTISKNPLTDEILKDEFGIDKLGHRARILNKLKEDSKHFFNQLRDSVVCLQTAENNKICSECHIY